MNTCRRAAVACFTLLFGVLAATAAAAADGPPPATVRLAPVVTEEVAQTREVIGILYYDRISEISTELAGLVDRVEVDEGDSVRRGDPLVILNTEILDQEIEIQKSRLAQTELRIANTKKNYSRLDRLFDQSGVSEKEYDDARFAYEDAEKEKQTAENTLRKLELQKERSVISAPFDGIVLTKDVDVGGWVQPGRQLVSVGASDDLVVRAPIAETTLQFIEAGQPVPVTIRAYGETLTGTVKDVDPVADLKTKNVFLKISIPEPRLSVQNLSATVTVPVSPRQNLAILQRSSVVKFQGNDFVYTVEDGKAVILPINIVAYLGDRVGVDSPSIAPGMAIVIEGNERLRPDQPVAVVGE